MKVLHDWDSMTIRELVALRDDIEAELHRRACIAFPSDGLNGPYRQTRSVTVLSRDGAAVKVAFFDERTPETVAVLDDVTYDFPSIGDNSGPMSDRQWSWRSHVLPLAIYEAGPAAIEARRIAEEQERREASERYERAEYERLRKKFDHTDGSDHG